MRVAADGQISDEESLISGVGRVEGSFALPVLLLDQVHTCAVGNKIALVLPINCIKMEVEEEGDI